jgi:hypothetical protein
MEDDESVFFGLTPGTLDESNPCKDKFKATFMGALSGNNWNAFCSQCLLVEEAKVSAATTTAKQRILAKMLFGLDATRPIQVSSLLTLSANNAGKMA